MAASGTHKQRARMRGMITRRGRGLRLHPARARIDSMSERETTTSGDLASLYRHAFAEYGTQALWNKRMLEDPTPEDALVVARALRIEGDRAARRIAEQIESICGPEITKAMLEHYNKPQS